MCRRSWVQARAYVLWARMTVTGTVTFRVEVQLQFRLQLPLLLQVWLLLQLQFLLQSLLSNGGQTCL